MKLLTLILLSLVFTPGVYASIETSADPDEKSSTKVAVMNGTEGVKLCYVNDQPSAVTIVLYDQNGRKLYKQKVKSVDGFIQPFNFRNLSEGKYTFEVTDDEGTVVQELVHTKSTPSKIKTSLYRIKDSEKYKLSIENDTKKPVEVSIFDENKKMVYRENINAQNPLSKTYDLSKIKSNGYTFKVSNKGNTTYSYIQ